MKIVARLVVIGIISLVLSACSSSMSRFEYPVMGMNGSPDPAEEKGQKMAETKYSPPDYDTSRSQKRYSNDQYSSNKYSQNKYGQDKSSNNRSYRDQYAQNRTPQNRYVPKQEEDYKYNDRREVSDTASFDKKRGRGLYSDGGDNTQNYERKQLPELTQNAQRREYNNKPKDYSKPQNTATRDPNGRHIVREGDTLYNISRRYSVTASEISRANNLENNGIKLGQHLDIPGLTKTSRIKTPAKISSRYKVAEGDTAYSIARRHGVTTSELARANNLDDLTKLKMGQQLDIPSNGKYQKPVQVASIDKKIGLKNVRVEKQPVRKPVKKVKLKKRSPAKKRTSSKQLTGNGKFMWPARGRILSSFGRQKSGTINDGVNVALPAGSKVKAAGDGVVAYAGSELKGYGKLILVRHKNNWVTAYAHNSNLIVKRGDKVRRGQVIAKSGKSGSVVQPQLHFELRRGSKPVNPMKYLALN